MRASALTTPRKTSFFWTLIASAFLLTGSELWSQQFTEDFSIWPLDLRIKGTVVACAGPEIDPSVYQSFKRAGKGKSKIVALCFHQGFEKEALQSTLGDDEEVTFFHQQESKTDVGELKDSLTGATGILIFSSDALAALDSELLDQIQMSLKGIIHRGGVVCAVGPALSSLGKFRHPDGKPAAAIAAGLDLVPDGILYWNYIDSSQRRSMNVALADKPHSVAIGVPGNTTMFLRGRKCFTRGEGKVTYSISANERQAYRVQHLADVSGRRASPYNSVVDLTAWRRDAIERQLPAFPESKPPEPVVEKGTLLIVGGGGMPKGLMDEMVELAGGKEAHMVYVPCTEQESVGPQRIVRQWKRMGVASAAVFHTKDRTKANSDEEFLKTMERATGVWFGGGRQWNFADSYYGTRAHKLMKEVLSRDGVIGGSSAGASIQGGYLARANPVANFDIMAPGYERGLGFLPGVAIDQHFSQRGRQKDMTLLADRYPQLLGIGIDEATALRVRGSTAEIVGRGKVFFYDRGKTDLPDQKDYTALSAGQSFDLKLRTLVEAD